MKRYSWGISWKGKTEIGKLNNNERSMKIISQSSTECWAQRTGTRLLKLGELTR
jgi:hypothetical protein